MSGSAYLIIINNNKKTLNMRLNNVQSTSFYKVAQSSRVRMFLCKFENFIINTNPCIWLWMMFYDNANVIIPLL